MGEFSKLLHCSLAHFNIAPAKFEMGYLLKALRLIKQLWPEVSFDKDLFLGFNFVLD